MLSRLKKLFAKEEPPKQEKPVVPKTKTKKSPKDLATEEGPPKQEKPVVPKTKTKKSPKDLATERGEPWVEVIGMDLDPADPGNGAFELDWNDKFVANLVRAGYQGKTDVDIVDNWFKTVCRNVFIETWEQEQADPQKRTSNRRDIGGGRSEIS